MSQLVELLPWLFGDLIDGRAELLQEYHRMEWKHVDTMMLEPSFELDIMVTQRLSKWARLSWVCEAP